jgi:hypothetical protein
MRRSVARGGRFRPNEIKPFCALPDVVRGDTGQAENALHRAV